MSTLPASEYPNNIVQGRVLAAIAENAAVGADRRQRVSEVMGRRLGRSGRGGGDNCTLSPTRRAWNTKPWGM